jgi:DNA-binding NarL/FixJ family response regulator
MPIIVSIVEDDAEIRQSLGLIIRGTAGFVLKEAYASGEEALEGIPKALPNVVLMDIELPGLRGVEVVRRLKPRNPSVQYVMLTVFDDGEDLFQSLTAGATGYLLKRTPPSRILDAIEEVHAGGSPMSPQIARMVVERFSPATAVAAKESLTARECEVLDYLVKGYRYKEIADALGLGVETVHTHLRRIYEKLQVRTRTEAVVKHLRR